MMISMTNGRRLSSALLMTMMLQGCANYPAVATLSTTMSKSIDSWKPFVSDYAATCRRRTWYEPAGTGPGDSCSAFDATQTTLNADLAVLQAYFGALAAISVNSNYSIDGGVKSLADAAAAADSDNKDKISAAMGLASTIAGWITAGERRHSLVEAVSHADEASIVVDGISSVLNGVYRQQLMLEARQWRDDVKGGASAADAMAKLVNAGAKPLGLPPLCTGKFVQWNTPDRLSASGDQLMYQHFYIDRCNSILLRISALDQFTASSDALKKALSQLSTEPFKLKDKELMMLLFAQSKDLAAKVDAVNKAFQGSSGTSETEAAPATQGGAS